MQRPDDLGVGGLQSCIAMPAFVLPSRSLNHHPTGSRLIAESQWTHIARVFLVRTGGSTWRCNTLPYKIAALREAHLMVLFRLLDRFALDLQRLRSGRHLS
jgi:hypothetical protein